MKKSFILMLPIILSGCSMKDFFNKKQDIENNQVTEKFDYTNAANVFILSGQSNMEGQSLESSLPGYLSDNNLPTDIYKNGFEDIKLSYVGKENQSNDEYPMEGKFVTTKLGYGASKSRFGPEIGLAEKLTGKSTKPVYLIKFTYSGAGFYGDPNFRSPSSGKTGKLYTDMVEFITNCLYLITQDGYLPVIRGLLWMQGEADGYSSTGGANYKTNFSAFLKDIRDEFKAYSYKSNKDNIALIDAYISKDSMWTYCDQVNNAKKEISLESPNNYLINTLSDGLDLKLGNSEHGGGDAYHYTVDSILRLGHEFGNIILENNLLNI